jgi:hypothetical protein
LALLLMLMLVLALALGLGLEITRAYQALSSISASPTVPVV